MPLRLNTTTLYAAQLEPHNTDHVHPIRLVEVTGLWRADLFADHEFVRSRRQRQWWDPELFGTIGRLAATNADLSDTRTGPLETLKVKRLPDHGRALHDALTEWTENTLRPNGLRLRVIHTSRQVISTWTTYQAQRMEESA